MRNTHPAQPIPGNLHDKTMFVFFLSIYLSATRASKTRTLQILQLGNVFDPISVVFRPPACSIATDVDYPIRQLNQYVLFVKTQGFRQQARYLLNWFVC